MIGHKLCGECGGDVGLYGKPLGQSCPGIYSKCRQCGFREWEDTIPLAQDHLAYMANLYGVSESEIVALVQEP